MMDERDRPLSTSDLAGSTAGAGPTGPQGGSAATTGTAAAPTQQQLDDEPGGVSLTGTRAGAGETMPLLGDEETGSFRGRWEVIQADFVDQPRRSVEQADGLVAEVMQRLAQTFSETRQDLEQQWSGGGEAGTEELRIALQRYRSFFETLLRR